MSIGPGSAPAKFRPFSRKASRAALPAFQVLMGLVGLLRNQSVTLVAARDSFHGNFIATARLLWRYLFIYFLIYYEPTEEKALTELVETAEGWLPGVGDMGDVGQKVPTSS